MSSDTNRVPALPAGRSPLEHVGFEVDRAGAVTVHVKQLGQPFGLPLAAAQQRIDEFKVPDRARLLRELPDYYSVPGCNAADFAHVVDGLVRHQFNRAGAPAPAGSRKAKP